MLSKILAKICISIYFNFLIVVKHILIIICQPLWTTMLIKSKVKPVFRAVSRYHMKAFYFCYLDSFVMFIDPIKPMWFIIHFKRFNEFLSFLFVSGLNIEFIQNLISPRFVQIGDIFTIFKMQCHCLLQLFQLLDLECLIEIRVNEIHYIFHSDIKIVELLFLIIINLTALFIPVKLSFFQIPISRIPLEYIFEKHLGSNLTLRFWWSKRLSNLFGLMHFVIT